MTNAELVDQVRAALAAAESIPLEWFVEVQPIGQRGREDIEVYSPGLGGNGLRVGLIDKPRDAALIAAAPAWLAALAERLERVEEEAVRLVEKHKPHEAAGALTATLALLQATADRSTAKNYVEITFAWDDGVLADLPFRRSAITLYRDGGKSPHELREEAEARAEHDRIVRDDMERAMVAAGERAEAAEAEVARVRAFIAEMARIHPDHIREMRRVAGDALECAGAWEPTARLIGNVMACELAFLAHSALYAAERYEAAALGQGGEP